MPATVVSTSSTQLSLQNTSTVTNFTVESTRPISVSSFAEGSVFTFLFDHFPSVPHKTTFHLLQNKPPTKMK